MPRFFGHKATALAVICLVLVGMRPQVAAAQEQVFTLRLTSTQAWDANVFRLPSSAADPQPVPGVTGRSDQISTTTVGLAFDKEYSQQRFQLDVSETATRYGKFSFLDRNAFNYRSAWLWHLTPRISGVLSADRAESIIGFEDTQALQRNISVTANRNFSVDAWLFGGWHMLAGISEFERENTLVFLAVPSIRQTSTDFGLRYETASGSSITVTRRLRKGINIGQEIDAVNFVDREFTVHESEVAARWIASARSGLNGRLTAVERHHKHVPQRDFSGIGGELGMTWQPTGKLGANLSATRVVASYLQGTASSYRVDNGLAFAPVWQVSERFTVRARASRLVYDYRGPVAPLAGPQRRDTLRSAQIAASWAPHPKVTLTASVQRDQRSSTNAAFTFNDTITSFNASLAY